MLDDIAEMLKKQWASDAEKRQTAKEVAREKLFNTQKRLRQCIEEVPNKLAAAIKVAISQDSHYASVDLWEEVFNKLSGYGHGEPITFQDNRIVALRNPLPDLISDYARIGIKVALNYRTINWEENAVQEIHEITAEWK